MIMLKSDGCLKPFYESDHDAFHKIKDGMVKVTVTRPRNLKHHRKFFAILELVVDNSKRFHHAKDLLRSLKMKMGLIEYVPDLDSPGEIIPVPASINFESMGQAEFEEFYARAIPLLAAEIGVTINDFEENYVDYM